MVLAGVEAGEGRLACDLAALLEDRDVLSGRPDEVPTDLAVRLRLLEGRGGGHPLVDPGALAHARRSARDLARRTGLAEGTPARGEAGTLVALAYPDRIARRRPGAGSGRFRLAAGGGAWMAPHDELADEALVVAAELDGDRRDARIRLAAALDEEALVAASKAPVAERRRTVWDRERDEPAVEVVRHLDGVELSVRVEPATAGEQTTAALVEHVRRVGLGALGWSASSRALLDRMAFLHAHRPGSWPPVSEAHLLAMLAQSRARALVVSADLAPLGRSDVTSLGLEGIEAECGEVLVRTLQELDAGYLMAQQPDKGRILREGGAIAILSYGTRLGEVLAAAEKLAALGLNPTIADARFMKPLDEDLIASLAQQRDVLLTVEEGGVGGFGSHVATFLARNGLLDGNGTLYWVFFSSVLFYAASYYARGYLAGWSAAFLLIVTGVSSVSLPLFSALKVT